MTSSDMTEQGSPSTTTPTTGRPEVLTPGLRVKAPDFLKAGGSRTPSTPTASTAPGGSPGPVSDPLDAAPRATGSTPSSGSKTPGGAGAIRLDRRALSDLLREAVYVTSGFVHEYLARSDDARAEGLWLAEERDQQQIGDPLASIGARHGIPVDGGADVADLIAAGFGALAYVTRNAAKAWRIRRGRRQVADVDPIREGADQ